MIEQFYKGKINRINSRDWCHGQGAVLDYTGATIGVMAHEMPAVPRVENPSDGLGQVITWIDRSADEAHFNVTCAPVSYSARVRRKGFTTGLSPTERTAHLLIMHILTCDARPSRLSRSGLMQGDTSLKASGTSWRSTEEGSLPSSSWRIRR